MQSSTSSVRAPARQQELMLQCPVCGFATIYEQCRSTRNVYYGCYTCQGTSDFVRDAAGRTKEMFLVATLQAVQK